MKQVAHKLGTGRLTVEQVPAPAPVRGMVVIRNHYSLISAGTEVATVRTARSSLVSKARQRPAEVRMVMDLCRRQGPVQAYRAVMKKLDAHSPLGYSAAGEVIDVGPGVDEFAIGDLAAAAGAGYANHAEIISVPVNLCVKLPRTARLDLAAYNTVGAIALQGVRQADLRIGETCVVIGLGLIGQLTGLLLRAAGVRTIGVDVNPYVVNMAANRACDAAWLRSDETLADRIDEFTKGIGADAVIITAATSNSDPIDFAGRVARKRGRVVVVGAVPTGFQRDPYWYRKELELRMSCSYGPGRYDPNYEEKGIDYPPGYVRWSEKRNMAAFQDLVHTGRIDIEYLTTHRLDVEEAPEAYELLVRRTEPFLGILLRYDSGRPIVRTPIRVFPARRQGAKAGLAFIGAGSYAQGYLLPNLPEAGPDLVRRAVVSNSGATSKRVAEKFRFELCTCDPDSVFADGEVNTVFIATRHDSHADYVVRGLRAGKHVFVEKPLALTAGQLADVAATYEGLAKPPLLMVGYNRRFSVLASALKEELGDGPMSMIYRVNAGPIPASSWIQDAEIGGGRIVGEVCHFVDFLTFACGSLPSRVYALALPDAQGALDTVDVQITFENGSIGTIGYYANGSKNVEKEYFEAYSSGRTAVIRDFRRLDVYRSGKHAKRGLWFQDKGQKRMLQRFLEAVRSGKSDPIPFEELRRVSAVTFAARESLVSRCPVVVT